MKKSEFNGSAWGIFGWMVLISLSSFLFLIPLAFVMPRYWTWYYSHVIIDDRQLEFNEEGPYWGAIGWALFSVITFGIGTFFAQKKMNQYIISHVHVAGEPVSESSFYGSAWGIFGWSIVSSLAMFFFMIPYAFVYPLVAKWQNDHTIVSGRQLVLDYSGPYWGVIGWAIFSAVTFGIGSFYAEKKLTQWLFANTHFDQDIEYIEE